MNEKKIVENTCCDVTRSIFGIGLWKYRIETNRPQLADGSYMRCIVFCFAFNFFGHIENGPAAFLLAALSIT